MDRTGLINKVKVILDEYAPGDVGLPFEEYVGPLLDESAREILTDGPLHLLTPTPIPLTSGSPPTSIVKYADNKAYIPVPSDFLRIYEIKYPLWKKSVRIAISKENPEYRLQDNEYLRSGYGRPFVAIVLTSVAGGAVTRYLECGRVENPGAGSLTPVALYVKDDKPENLAEQFVDTLTWRCASKVLAVMGDANRSKMALEQSMSHLNSIII